MILVQPFLLAGAQYRKRQSWQTQLQWFFWSKPFTKLYQEGTGKDKKMDLSKMHLRVFIVYFRWETTWSNGSRMRALRHNQIRAVFPDAMLFNKHRNRLPGHLRISLLTADASKSHLLLCSVCSLRISRKLRSSCQKWWIPIFRCQRLGGFRDDKSSEM